MGKCVVCTRLLSAKRQLSPWPLSCWDTNPLLWIPLPNCWILYLLQRNQRNRAQQPSKGFPFLVRIENNWSRIKYKLLRYYIVPRYGFLCQIAESSPIFYPILHRNQLNGSAAFYRVSFLTLDSRINVAPGTFSKNDKHSPLNNHSPLLK